MAKQRINMVPQSRTTSEDAYYSAALLKPKPDEKLLLITAVMHMPRAVGCFRGGMGGIEAGVSAQSVLTCTHRSTQSARPHNTESR
jgi:uncharacterized SAM-binding protein YcdF (DUF218 family)